MKSSTKAILLGGALVGGIYLLLRYKSGETSSDGGVSLPSVGGVGNTGVQIPLTGIDVGQIPNVMNLTPFGAIGNLSVQYLYDLWNFFNQINNQNNKNQTTNTYEKFREPTPTIVNGYNLGNVRLTQGDVRQTVASGLGIPISAVNSVIPVSSSAPAGTYNPSTFTYTSPQGYQMSVAPAKVATVAQQFSGSAYKSSSGQTYSSIDAYIQSSEFKSSAAKGNKLVLGK